MQLRDYQQRAIDDIRGAFARGHKRVCFQLPTGGGKTIISAFMIKNAIEKGKKVLFLVHLRELIEQTEEKLESVGVSDGIRLDMIQTFANRLDYRPDFIVVDEFHHAVSNTYLKVMDHLKGVPLVGLTATPQRLDGKGLWPVADVIVKGPRMADLIDDGYLADYDIVSVDTGVDLEDVHTSYGDYDKNELTIALERSRLYGDTVETYKKYINGKKAVGFWHRVDISKRMTQKFNDAGISCVHVDGEMTDRARKEAFEGLRSGKYLVVNNCALISEGVDVPDIYGVIQGRPTQSLSLYLQMIGRALRPKPDGSKALIIDQVKNWSRHGLPCQDREWTLEDRKKSKQKTELDIQVHVCEQCFVVYHSKNKICPYCGLQREIKIRNELKEIDVDIKVIDKEAIKARAKNEQTTARTYDDLVKLAKQRGYKPGWAKFVWEARQKKHGRRN